jgi:hypothetical protein
MKRFTKRIIFKSKSYAGFRAKFRAYYSKQDDGKQFIIIQKVYFADQKLNTAVRQWGKLWFCVEEMILKSESFEFIAYHEMEFFHSDKMHR